MNLALLSASDHSLNFSFLAWLSVVVVDGQRTLPRERMWRSRRRSYSLAPGRVKEKKRKEKK